MNDFELKYLLQCGLVHFEKDRDSLIVEPIINLNDQLNLC